MEVVVDLSQGTLHLTDPGDAERFSVRVAAVPGPDALLEGDGPEALGERLDGVLGAAGAGRVADDGDAFILPDAVRRLAGAAADAGWEARFADMCAYAATKGWVDPADQAIQAHVVWPGADG